MSPSEWIRNRNPRVLWYCHTPPREIYDPTVENLRKRSVKESVMYSSLSRVYSGMENGIVKNIEEIATNSNNTKGRIKRAFHRDATVINPAIEYKRFRDNGDGKYFIYPSRIAEQKRQEYAIEAFSIFQKMSKYKNYKLILAGSMSKRYSDFSKYYEKLKAMKVKNVVFRINPTNDELAALYSKSTAVLFTAINEDYGIVPLEGMASSKPVISVNEGGPRETIIDGKTGFLVNNPREMANKMALVAENSALSQKIGREGRKLIEKDYSWEAFFKKFDRLAKQVSKR
jgi:glycosyltransferase involved in cell wall biosynthesis